MSILLSVGACAQAAQQFKVSEPSSPGAEWLLCDLDGDGLKDLVVMDDLDVSVFYQDRTQGFTHEPQATFHLEHRPCVVWSAKLGRPAASLLVMTSEGVNELVFTNRSAGPEIRQIIRQATIVPAAVEGVNARRVTLSAETGGPWPLLLVPAPDGLQVWRHGDGWQRTQAIKQGVEILLWPNEDSGYDSFAGFDLAVSDANGDGRDDLMIRRELAWTNTYSLYLQQTNGQFAPEPALTSAERIEPHAMHCWTDLNHDGRMDLVKSVWLQEPWFAQGFSSGKVLVGIYMADEQGRIPGEPQQVFRRNDWLPAAPVDIDGDGFPDLVLGYVGLDTREGLRKAITAKQLDYTLRFHFNRPGAGFVKEADFARAVVIHMDQPLTLMGGGMRQYFENSVQFGGDFNGDGRKDLLVRDRSDKISVYFFISRQQGFSAEPDLRFHCAEMIDKWEVADLNNDGVSDLVVKLVKENGFRVFISGK